MPETGAGVPRDAVGVGPGRTQLTLQVGHHFTRSAIAAGDVVTDVGDPGRPLLGGEEGVEAGHSVRLGRGDGETLADVVERTPADPADRGLHGGQGGQEQMAPRSDLGTGSHDTQVSGGAIGPADPARVRGPEHVVDHGPLLGRRVDVEKAQVHLQLLDPDGGGFELGRPRLRVPRLDGERVDVGLVGEVERHEGETLAESRVDPDRRFERASP